jgi:hypothetical protein
MCCGQIEIEVEIEGNCRFAAEVEVEIEIECTRLRRFLSESLTPVGSSL